MIFCITPQEKVTKTKLNTWDNIKRTNTQIIGVPEKREKEYEKILEILVKNFHNMVKPLELRKPRESHTG